MAYDIFISYRRVDINGKSNVATARTFKFALEDKGYNVFFDYSECTDDLFEDKILPAIRTCRCFLLVLTAGALDRCKNEGDWLRREIEEAMKYSRKIVPVTPDDNLFDGYPSDLPQLLETLPKIQVTTIHMGRIFEKCIDTLVEDRIPPRIKRKPNLDVIDNPDDLHIPKLKLGVDMDCIFYIDGEEKCRLQAGVIQKVPLAQGEYELRFVSIENPADQKVEDLVMPDADKLKRVSLCELRDKRLAAERAEAERQAEERRLEEERKRQEEEIKRKAEEERKRKSNMVFKVGGVEFTMVYVEGGRFQMGSPDWDSDAYSDEKPQHWVSLSDYHIGETVVTQALWKAVMKGNPSCFKGDDNLPVENVAWESTDKNVSVQEFLKRLNETLRSQLPQGRCFRLPTEAEWEYAARGGQNDKGYKYSGSNTIGDVAWYDSNSGDKTHPAMSKTPNELGLYNMSGNVGEWCQDYKGDYPGGEQDNPSGPKQGYFRVFRGGCWPGSARDCRVAYRGYNTPDYRYSSLGFRLAL